MSSHHPKRGPFECVRTSRVQYSRDMQLFDGKESIPTQDQDQSIANSMIPNIENGPMSFASHGKISWIALSVKTSTPTASCRAYSMPGAATQRYLSSSMTLKETNG